MRNVKLQFGKKLRSLMVMELPDQPGLSSSGVASDFCHTQPSRILTDNTALDFKEFVNEHEKKDKI